MSIRVLFVRGLPDDNSLRGVMHEGKLRYLILGCANVRNAIRRRFQTAELLFIGKGPVVPVKYRRPPHIIFNEISDPDTHGLSLAKAEAFCNDFENVPVINVPASVRRTTRDQLSKRLQDVPGLIMPRTIRCQPTSPTRVNECATLHGLRYPILVRVAGAHGGKTLVKIDSPSQLDPLHGLPLDGRDYYLTEFHEFQSDDGLYRKYRFAVVDGKPFIRHMIVNDDWLIHAADVAFASERPELQREEEHLITSFDDTLASTIEPAIRAIHKATEMDYFGIDCNVSQNGDLLLFEVNANMNVLMNSRPKPNVSERAIDKIRAAVEELILEKAGHETGL